MALRRETAEKLAEQLQSALALQELAILEPVFADDVRWGSCIGRPQVLAYLARLLNRGMMVELTEFETHSDRLIARLELSSAETEELPLHQGHHFVVIFVHNDQIVELQLATDREEALATGASPQPPPRPAVPTRINGLAAVLPVGDLTAALLHYQRLGFTVRSYAGGGYGYAERDGQNLHLRVVEGLNPATTTNAIYLYVEDADLLFAEWRSSGVSGQFFEPRDTDYGLREGAHIDRDGNLMRFGSPLQSRFHAESE